MVILYEMRWYGEPHPVYKRPSPICTGQYVCVLRINVFIGRAFGPGPPKSPLPVLFSAAAAAAVSANIISQLLEQCTTRTSVIKRPFLRVRDKKKIRCPKKNEFKNYISLRIIRRTNRGKWPDSRCLQRCFTTVAEFREQFYGVS